MKLNDTHGVAVVRGETDAPEGTPQAAPRNTIPDEVQRALDRMCTPLHESVLKGATAEADARSMRIIREHIERTAWSTVERDGLPPVDGHTVFIGINSAGYACCFNAIWQGQCVMETAEGSYQQMSDLRQWRRLDRPLTP